MTTPLPDPRVWWEPSEDGTSALIGETTFRVSLRFESDMTDSERATNESNMRQLLNMLDEQTAHIVAAAVSAADLELKLRETVKA